MYNNVSEQFATTIRSPSRTFNLRLKINGKWIDAGFKKMSYETASTSDEGIQIGSAVAAKIELTVKRIDELFENTEIPIEIGLKLPSGKYEYIPLGFFTAEHPTLDQATTTFTAYDRMMKTTGVYVSELTYPASAESVLKEISTGCGVPCNVSGLNGITIDTAPVGYTYREVIGYIASLAGGFACVDRTGTIVIKWYEDNDYTINESRIMTFEKNESDYHLDYLTCNVDSNTSFTAGSGTLGITFDNPLTTEEKLNSVYKKVRGFTYRGASLKTLGDIRLDPWDIVTVEESGETYKVPVMNITHEYDGGLAMTITAYGKTETETETDYKGPSTKLTERTYAEMMLTKELVSKKVDAEWVKANTVTAETIVSVNNELQYIKNNYLKSNEADIKFATIEEEKVIKSDIEQLNVKYEKVGILDGDVAGIKTLMFGSSTGKSITTDFANSVVSMIGTAQIKDSMIDSLDAKKIKALDIDTTDVKVHSKDGKSQWTDNTIQISDSSRLRVQIGKDASGDYNMYVWDKAGNLMFDALGLTEKGVQREIIRNDMVKEDADISASKLDIGSLFDVINNDGSHTLKSSKIYVDSDKQTLDVSFKTITTKTDTAVTAANKADTKAQSVLNRANAGEFKGDKGDKGDTGATGKGVSAITPQYYLSTSNTTQSGGSWSNTRPSWVAGRYYWTRDYIQWTDGSVTASTPQLATDLNNLYSSLQTVTNTVSSQGTQLSTVQGQISSKVWQQDITTAVTNLQIGGRNLLTGSAGWTKANPAKSTNAADAYAYIGGKVYLENGKTYTLQAVSDSVWATGHGGQTGKATIWLHGLGDGFHRVFCGDGKTSGRYTWTFVHTSATQNCEIRINGYSKVTSFWDIKIESGNKATDWTPAPEDIDANISSVEGKITTVSNQYTTLNQSLASLKATVNSNTTAISKKADNSTVTEINNRVTTLTADLSGIKQSISATYVTKTEYAKEIDRLGDNINNVDDKASAAQDWCQTIEDNITDRYSTTVQMNNAITQAVSAESNSIKLEVSGTYATKNDINNLQIGGRNLIRAYYIKHFDTGSTVIGEYITSGKVVCQGNGVNTGFRFDSINCYEPSTQYVLSGYITVTSKSCNNIYVFNGKRHSFISFKIDGIAYSNPFDIERTDVINILNDGKPHFFELRYETNANIPADVDVSYTYIQLNKNNTTQINYEINGLKLEKGNKATDWSQAPEDVNTKFNNYATTASLSAYIAKTDTGALKSCIEAIADNINLTAGGSINISGNKSVNIRGNTFSLDSSGTKISNTGYLQTVNAKLGEWNVDSKAIYCETADKVYTAYLQNPDYVVGNTREDAWVYSVQKNGIATFYVTSEGDLYCRCFSTPYTTYQPNYRWTTYENNLNTTLFIRTFHGPCLIIANVSIWTDDTSDYGTIKCGLYLDGYCVTENQHRLETTNAIELSAGATYVWYFSDNEAHTLSGIGGSTKNGKKTITYSVQALFNNDVGWGTGQ